MKKLIRTVAAILAALALFASGILFGIHWFLSESEFCIVEFYDDTEIEDACISIEWQGKLFYHDSWIG